MKTDNTTGTLNSASQQSEVAIYAVIDNEQCGPYNEVQFKRLVDNGLVTSETLIWSQELPSWVKAGEVDALKSFFATVSAPVVPEPVQVPVVEQKEIQYYAKVDGEKHGPFNWNQFKRLADNDVINTETPVWHESLPSWICAKDLPELNGIIKEPVEEKPEPEPEPAKEQAPVSSSASANYTPNYTTYSSTEQNVSPTPWYKTKAAIWGGVAGIAVLLLLFLFMGNSTSSDKSQNLENSEVAVSSSSVGNIDVEEKNESDSVQSEELDVDKSQIESMLSQLFPPQVYYSKGLEDMFKRVEEYAEKFESDLGAFDADPWYESQDPDFSAQYQIVEFVEFTKTQAIVKMNIIQEGTPSPRTVKVISEDGELKIDDFKGSDGNWWRNKCQKLLDSGKFYMLN
ncbi:MAG: DUF4339 domain-containing protein [Bacteroidaceae bacterium]|nr:DUF4339 domain-containing protein [Bacteroidaceae bacterium]